MNKLYSKMHCFTELLFPPLCAACHRVMARGEEFVCTDCRIQMPLSNYSDWREYNFFGRFNGVPLPQAVYSLFTYRKGSNFDRLIYEIKYNGKTKLGNYMGHMLGTCLQQYDVTWDAIIPVAMHDKRRLQRGYNQAEVIAAGVADVLGIEVRTDVMRRIDARASQTTMSMGERISGTGICFEADDSKITDNEHILLIDDVITSGSTMIACCAALCKAKQVRITLASLGRTEAI
ncbi:MAG: ComF family protein [Marinifilaceae bacterium]